MGEKRSVRSDDVEFGGVVVFARAVSVEVVFEEVGNDCVGWVDVCLCELETTEFVDDIVRIFGGVKKVDIRQNGISDVAD